MRVPRPTICLNSVIELMRLSRTMRWQVCASTPVLISREVQAQRSDRRQPEGFYYWEFRQGDGTGILGVRKAENEPFTITLYNTIPAGDVTVYRAQA